MADSSPTSPLFDLWKKGLEEGAQAWSRLLTQSPATMPDPTAFWRPVVEQWVQAWARMFAQTPLTPDVSTQWKHFLDQSIDAWSRALGQAMNTDAFAQMLGRYLDQWLTTYAPMKRAMDQSLEGALTTLNLASRAQLTAVAKQLVELENRLERVEDGVDAVLRRLDELTRGPSPRKTERTGASTEGG